MQKEKHSNYKKLIGERIQKLINLSGLEVSGFADYANLSDSHLYAILNGTRDLTGDVADKIGAAFDLEGTIILRINYNIPKRIKKSKSLNKFYVENKNVKSYFIKFRDERKDSYYVENDIFNSGLFESPVYTWEIEEYCMSEGRLYQSKKLSQILNYMVENGKLKSKKQLIKLRSGKFGKRMVNVYFK